MTAGLRDEPSTVTTPEVADLSLVEVPAAHEQGGHTMVIMLTGDRSWAGIDKSLAAGLGAPGIPVVGWSSLGYYWTPRTPLSAAADLARIIEHYTMAWHRWRVVIVGYSFGPRLRRSWSTASRSRPGLTFRHRRCAPIRDRLVQLPLQRLARG